MRAAHGARVPATRSSSSATGDVLVVGASASGVQIADELATRRPRRHDRGRASTSGSRAGTAVGTSTGGSTAIGQLDERYDEVDDIERARRHASVQLVGDDERRDLDLNALAAGGVARGRPADARCAAPPRCAPAGSAHLVANADLKQARLLRRIDEFVDGARRSTSDRRSRAARRRRSRSAPTELDLADFSTVIWATGLPADVPRGSIRRRSTGGGRVDHDGGVARDARSLRARAARSCGAAARTSSAGSAPTPSTSSVTCAATSTVGPRPRVGVPVA